jgi:hypothetical protein
MAQTTFVLQAPKKVDAATALASAKQKDARNVNFHIPAAKDEILTLTGDILEISWESGEGKDKRTGTILCADAKREDGSLLPSGVPFGFFRSKKLREESGDKDFPACFPSSATFEDILTSIKKDVKIKVARDGYVYPGRSSSRDVDTVVWAK